MLFVFSGLLLGCGGGMESTTVNRQESDPFAELDAYGEWMNYPELGRVWQPRVAYDWQPFTEGRWVWTDQGWLWYSDEPFGWAVYHYGYWTNEGAAGWLWVPGYEWSPARVRWVVRDDLIGWAPMEPPGRRLPVAVEEREWVSVHPREFGQRNVGRSRGPRPGVNPDRRDESGRPPDVKMIERATNVPVAIERVETDPVGSGGRKVVRVRISEKEEPVQPRKKEGSTHLPSAPVPPAVPPPVKPAVTPPVVRSPQPPVVPPAKSSPVQSTQKERRVAPGKKTDHPKKAEPAKEPRQKKPVEKKRDGSIKEDGARKKEDKKKGDQY